MMTPSPSAGDLTLRHGANGSPHPDRCIDMYDPDANDDDRRSRMNENTNRF